MTTERLLDEIVAQLNEEGSTPKVEDEMIIHAVTAHRRMIALLL